MKKLAIQNLLIISFLIFHFTSFAQEIAPIYSGDIIAGTKKWFTISLYDQPSVTAMILGIDGDGIIIKESQDKYVHPRKIDLNMITNIKEINYGEIGTVGIGYGIPYGGVFGIGCEINVIPILSLNGAVGTTILSGFGYNVGAKVYFREQGPTWRPRASIFYGINGLWAEDTNQIISPDNEKFAGLTAGLGQLFLWKKHGFDLDLMYLISSELYEVHPGNYTRVKISIGYRYAF